MSNIPPEIWGPHYWFVIHTFADIYPDTPNSLDKEVATNFIRMIPFILPCADCSDHAFAYIFEKNTEIPYIIQSKTNMVNFFRKFHDCVNTRLKKIRLYT